MLQESILLAASSVLYVKFGVIIFFWVINRITSAVHRESLENGEQRRAALVKSLKSEIKRCLDRLLC